MTESQVRETCAALPGTAEQIQWGNDLLFKVAGKMYVCFGLRSGRFSFKCEKVKFFELTELPGIVPAPYLARAHWVQIDPTACLLKTREIAELMRQSYELVVAKLPKKTQKALTTNGD